MGIPHTGIPHTGMPASCHPSCMPLMPASCHPEATSATRLRAQSDSGGPSLCLLAGDSSGGQLRGAARGAAQGGSQRGKRAPPMHRDCNPLQPHVPVTTPGLGPPVTTPGLGPHAAAPAPRILAGRGTTHLRGRAYRDTDRIEEGMQAGCKGEGTGMKEGTGRVQEGNRGSKRPSWFWWGHA